VRKRFLPSPPATLQRSPTQVPALGPRHNCARPRLYERGFITYMAQPTRCTSPISDHGGPQLRGWINMARTYLSPAPRPVHTEPQCPGSP